MARLSADGSVILEMYDSNTKESVNAKKTTTYWDGTSMTDAKVDNAVFYKVPPGSLGGGYAVIDYSKGIDIRRYGVKADGFTDDTVAFKRAIRFMPSASTLLIPQGTIVLSDTIVINKEIKIMGVGFSMQKACNIIPSLSFPANQPLFQYTYAPGRLTIHNICSFMDRRGGDWLEVVGDGYNYDIQWNQVRGISAGNWAIDFQNSIRFNGIGLSNISYNRFQDFDGGGLRCTGGGDSVNIVGNMFQLGNSSSHILFWQGVSGALCFNFSSNNATGSEKMIEIQSTLGGTINNNQFEAVIPVTNEWGSILAIGTTEVGITSIGWTISGNNFGIPDGEAETSIYFGDARDCYVINNRMSGAVYDVKCGSLAERITFLRGNKDTGGVYDTRGVVSVIDGISGSKLQSSLTFAGQAAANNGIKFGKDENVNAQLDIDPVSSLTTATAVVRFFRNAFTSGFKGLDIFKGDGTNSLQSRISAFGDSFFNILTGNFGIGTTAPTSKFHIISPTTNQARIGYDDLRYFTVNVASGGNTTLALSPPVAGTNTNGKTILFQAGAGTGTGKGNIQFQTATPTVSGTDAQTLSTKLFIDAGGNIGVGTDTPPAKVSVRAVPGEILRFENGNNANFYNSIFNGYSESSANNCYLALMINNTISGNQVETIRFTGSGNVGVGVSPTACVHIKSGGAAPGTAAQKFTSGALLSVIENGAWEFDGTHLYFSIGSTRYQLDQQGGVNTATDASTTFPTKSYLNTTYPSAKKSFKVYMANVTDGSVIAEKVDDSSNGNWFISPQMLAV